jgi:hypothetical protein
MPHCDDELLDGMAAMNGFHRRCPTDEAFLATDTYRSEKFDPVALINRFDMADASGATCGEYRIIFERDTTPVRFVNIIFEAGLRNPHPEQGLAACRPVAQFWAELSAIDSVAERHARLEKFFFQGIDGFPPVFHPDNFRDAPHGIRTMQWIPGLAPHFYQFRVVNECANGACRLFVKPDVLENMPSSSFLDATNTSDRAKRYRAHFLGQVRNLVIDDVNGFFMTTPPEFLVGENESGDRIEHAALLTGFSRNLRTPEGSAFWTQVQNAVHDAGSNLFPEEVIRRATQLNCEGCHSQAFPIGNGLFFPEAQPFFNHVSRSTFEKGDEGPDSRYAVSLAMRNVFIPNRMRILTDFLKNGTPPARSK